MLFLFRCAIFLGIVFYYLPWPEGAVSSLLSDGGSHHADFKTADVKTAVANAAGELGQAAARLAAREVEEACRKNPERCAHYAAHLAQLIRQENQASAASLAKYPLGPVLGEPHDGSAKTPAASFDRWSLRLRD